MPSERYTIHLVRESDTDRWGFGMKSSQDPNRPLEISEVVSGSFAELVGLRLKDLLININSQDVTKCSVDQVEKTIKDAGNTFDMIIERPDMNITKDLVEDPRYEGLDVLDRGRVGVNDVTKPSLRKDWNTPWCKRDGKGLKTIQRNIYGTDPVPAPVATSHFHFYSEPHSILEEEHQIPAEELERLIREHNENNSRPGSRQQQLQQSTKQQQQQPNEQKFDENPNNNNNNNNKVRESVDELDECEPPELEVVEQKQRVQLEVQQQQQLQVETNNNVEVLQQQQQIQQQHIQQQQQQIVVEKQEIVTKTSSEHQQQSTNILNIEAIRKSMEAYTGSESYEPSADELIQVLKNLENLAAANPALYRALVDQININTTTTKTHPDEELFDVDDDDDHFMEADNDPNNVNQPETVSYPSYDDEVDNNFNETEQVVPQQQSHDNNNVESMEPQQQIVNHQVDEVDLKQQQQQSMEQVISNGEPPIDPKLAARQKRIEEQVDEELKELRRRPRKPVQDSSKPPEVRKITVVAGSQHRASWPCAPVVSGTTAPRTIEVVLGATEEDSLQNRREVAEKAGLKHVDVIIGDEYYGESGGDFPWSGSLKPVGNKLNQRPRSSTNEPGSIPWAGSLRHVNEPAKKSKQRKNSDVHGDAPWMGTLRHVNHNNKVTTSFAKPQFKRYPDEDAPNPYKSMGGKDARPAYPLTPAAIINGNPVDNDEMSRRAENESVDRIRSNLRETRTVSSALLKVLMPKLLKEHESKYEPLGYDESQKIMEEILAMQIGLNTDQAVEDNDEAEQIIRAITHGEIDNSVYSQMADDLEQAAISKRKEMKKKKKKKKVGATKSASTSANDVIEAK